MTLYLACFAILAALLSAVIALFNRQRAGFLNVIIWLLNKNLPGIAPHRIRLTVLTQAVFEPARFSRIMRTLPFLLLGLSGVFAVLTGIIQFYMDGNHTAVLPIGLPRLNWHLSIDKLSGFFFCVLGVPLIAVSLYGPGYVREFEKSKYSLEVLGFFTGLFVAGMEMVLVADDAFFFMIAWELMSVSSYFLVAYQHENPANRRASFLYLLMAEMGALFIILGFGVLVAYANGFDFETLRTVSLTPVWASTAFTLALIGFGMKAGLVPLHAWLPEAHPVAPSHISALMSGVMLKIAVYGFLRFCYDLLPQMYWQWGVVVMLVGAASALLGILYALQQQNLKRLLAYSSIENIGIIFTSIGLSIIFFSSGQPQLGALGLLAALLHCFNHALFKSLLFLGAGVILHQTHEASLEKMGGLIHRMPKLAALFLLGTLSISALPPLNGFVSEWLTLQTALQATNLESGVLRSLIPTTAAIIALTGALAAACFVKVYGVAFLGLPRSKHIKNAHEVKTQGMLAGPALLAGLCIIFGIVPGPLINGIRTVITELTTATLPNVTSLGWLWLTPVNSQVASYSPGLVLLAFLLVGLLCYYLLYHKNKSQVRQVEPWDCGFGGLNAEMQYTSGSFSMPIRRIFKPMYNVQETLHQQTEGQQNWHISKINYQFQVNDKSWPIIYEPIALNVTHAAHKLGRIQTGSVRTYLSYSFYTLLFLLWVIS